MRASVRRLTAVVRTTVSELCGEPFVLLTLLASLALTVLAPAFHYHQFGEAARLARDAGFSAALVGGTVAAVFGAIRSIRREVESGTCETALAHAISPGAFLAAKILGFCLVVVVFFLSVFALTLVMVDGVEVGARLALKEGGLARPYGPSLAIGVGVLVLPILLAAAGNRFAGCRFTLTATWLSFALAVLGLGVRWRPLLALRYLPVFALALLPVLLLTVTAGILAFHRRANVAAAGTALVAAAFLPALGNYCVAEVLANGRWLLPSYAGWAVLAALPALAALLALGKLLLMKGEDLA